MKMCKHDVAVGSDCSKYPYGFLICARCGAVSQAIGMQQVLFTGTNGESLVGDSDGRTQLIMWFEQDEFPEKSRIRCWCIGMKPPVAKYEIQLSNMVRANVLNKAGADGQEAYSTTDPRSEQETW